MLPTFWLHSDYILTTFLLHSDCILTIFWYILTTSQTWDLSKNSHCWIFRSQIWHFFFRNLHHWLTFYTAGGSDGSDKSHLWVELIKHYTYWEKSRLAPSSLIEDLDARRGIFRSHLHRLQAVQGFGRRNLFHRCSHCKHWVQIRPQCWRPELQDARRVDRLPPLLFKGD